MMNMHTGEMWTWYSLEADSYYDYETHWYRFFNIITIIINFIKIIVGLFLASNITALYIKITIMCAPVFILFISIQFIFPYFMF